MREIHGVADCEKCQSTNENGRYPVVVTDGIGIVILCVGDQTYPAGLTPDRARQIAKQLVQSAQRVERPAHTERGGQT